MKANIQALSDLNLQMKEMKRFFGERELRGNIAYAINHKYQYKSIRNSSHYRNYSFQKETKFHGWPTSCLPPTVKCIPYIYPLRLVQRNNVSEPKITIFI